MIVIFFTADRIIGDTAVLLTDDEHVYEIKIAEIPFEIKEGDVLTGDITDGKVAIVSKDENEKSVRTERISTLFEKLKNKNRSDK